MIQAQAKVGNACRDNLTLFSKSAAGIWGSSWFQDPARQSAFPTRCFAVPLKLLWQAWLNLVPAYGASSVWVEDVP